MKLITSLLVLSAACVLLSRTAFGEVVGPSSASELVTLMPGGNCPDFAVSGSEFLSRIPSDGSQQQGFTIPVGNVLVITSVDWSVSGNGSASTSGLVDLILVDSFKFPRIVARQSTRIDSSGFASGAFVFPNGIAVQPGVPICIKGPAPGLDAFLHGYLTKEK